MNRSTCNWHKARKIFRLKEKIISKKKKKKNQLES